MSAYCQYYTIVIDPTLRRRAVRYDITEPEPILAKVREVLCEDCKRQAPSLQELYRQAIDLFDIRAAEVRVQSRKGALAHGRAGYLLAKHRALSPDHRAYAGGDPLLWEYDVILVALWESQPASSCTALAKRLREHFANNHAESRFAVEADPLFASRRLVDFIRRLE